MISELVKTDKNSAVRKTVHAAFFLAVGMVLPLLTAQVKEIGDSLLPMHLAVMLCGFLCGGLRGFAVGLVLPFLRSFVFGMPPMYPNAVWMAVELCIYGFATGFLYGRFFSGQLWWLYASLVISMLLGRLGWGAAKAVLLGVGDSGFTLGAFVTGGFIDAIPGIIIQLVVIPVIVERRKGK